MGSKGGKTKSEQRPLDDSKTKPSVRGTLIPYVLGAVRLGPIFGGAWGRTTYLVANASPGGGKGGGKPKPTYTTFYREKGWHILSLGKGRLLRVVNTDGVQTGDITRTGYPSGSTVAVGQSGHKGMGSFKVYWGEDTQPADSELVSHLGVNSSFPHTFGVVWNPRELGTAATWPSQEFEFEVETQFDTIGGKPAYIKTLGFDESNISMNHAAVEDQFFYTTDARAADIRAGYTMEVPVEGYEAIVQSVESSGPGWNIYTDTFAPFTGDRDFTVQGQPKSGVNPAAALWQMLFEPFPFGLGWDQNLFETSDFTTLAEYFAEDGPEPFPCSVYLSAGQSFKEGIISVLEDTGVGFWKDSTTGKYRFTVARPQAITATITKSQYAASDIELTYEYATMTPKNFMFAYDDVNRRFTRSTIRESNDGVFKFSDDPNSEKIDLNSVRDFNTANIVAARRAQEVEEKEEIPLTVPQELMDISLGGLYQIEGFNGSYRIKSKEQELKSGASRVVFVRDTYSIDNTFLPLEQDVIQAGIQGAYPDPRVAVLEPSRAVIPNEDGIFVARIRAHSQIVSSSIITSPDDTSYLASATPPQHCTGGDLLEALPDTDPTLIESGPLVSVVGPDILDVADLTSSEELWKSGSQIAIINNEVFYLRSILIVGPGQFRLQGLIRARKGTSIGDHDIGDTVYIMGSESFKESTPAFLAAGTEVYVKSLPSSSTTTIEADEVSPVNITYQGGGYRPLPISNLNTENMGAYWLAGEDVPIRWSYKNASGVAGAGILRTGETAATDPPEMQFNVIITDGVEDVKRTVTGLTSPNYTYTNTDMVSDFGVEPSTFSVIVISTLNGLLSDQVQKTIVRY